MRTSQIIPVKALAKAALLFDFSITRCQGWRLSRRPLTIRVRGDGHGKPTQARNGRQCAGAEVDCTSRARARGVAAPAVDDSAGRGSRPISADPRRSGATSALAADVGGFCARGPAAAPPSFFAEWWLAFLEPPSLGSRICLPARTVVEQGPALRRLSDNRSSSAPAICPCVLNATPNTLRRRRTRRRDRGCGSGWPALGERAAIPCGHGNSGASILVRRPGTRPVPVPATGRTTSCRWRAAVLTPYRTAGRRFAACCTHQSFKIQRKLLCLTAYPVSVSSETLRLSIRVLRDRIEAGERTKSW